MLSVLHIENIAVIELADIAFDARLNILTGETGAGKSIVIDSLNALLGRRTSRDLLRSGCETAEVTGVFCCCGADELSLARELRDDGRNLCRIDGKPVTLTVLRETGESLCAIHGQHDSGALLREETHIELLDAFAELPLNAYRKAYDRWTELESERRKLSVAEDEKRARIDILTHRLRELESIAPKPDEEETLSARRKTLRNAGNIREALSEAYFALYGDEDTRGASELSEDARDALSGAARTAPELETLAERLNEVCFTLRDCAEESRLLCESMEDSEEELEQLETRLDILSRLRRKHNMTLGEIISAGEKWASELDALESADRRLETLEKELSDAKKCLMDEAQKLTGLRMSAARRLETRMGKELLDLDMGKVRFAAEREESAPGPLGQDVIRFMIAANVGEPLKPLAKIASGGELARIMLAMKNLLSEGESIPTLVFDEVDSGVSGRAAQRVAQKLASVSRKKQVLCVTHLPQIAAFADTHFHIEKTVENGRTVTRVERLDRAGRIEELARIMAGSSVTDTTRKTAEELLAQAEQYKVNL